VLDPLPPLIVIIWVTIRLFITKRDIESFSDWVPVRIFSFTDAGTYEYRLTLGRQAARLVSIAEELPRGLEGKP
jgi:hypothetical protein